MQYIWHHTRHIIDHYKGTLPLTHFLKDYFRKQPRLGSRDRKMISEMVYCWYRGQKAVSGTSDFKQSVLACLLLCGAELPAVKRLYPDEWQAWSGAGMEQRLNFLKKQGISFDEELLTHFTPNLSDGITLSEFRLSLLRQPLMFIRLRAPYEAIAEQLTEKGIPFDHCGNQCLALPNGTKIEDLLPQHSYVVQDASSQSTGNFFRPDAQQHWWDCCCGAGGKSLLLKDAQPHVRLTVSDKRSSIIHNLLQRFERYRLAPPETLMIDVADAGALASSLRQRHFDHIICDVPCSGSGTWSRTPEQLYFFEEKNIPMYADRQKLIAGNAARYLAPGGQLFYITCSVFREENENVVAALLRDGTLLLEEQTLINGTGRRADSMYVAVLRKND